MGTKTRRYILSALAGATGALLMSNKEAFGQPSIQQISELEWPYDIPGGVQSELNLLQPGSPGFAGMNNFIPFKAGIIPRPNSPTTYGFSQRPINGIADFFDSTGTRQFLVMQSNQVYKYNFALDTFTALGGAITDTAANLYGWAVLANKFLFSQNVDKIWMWDGAAANVVNVSANAPICKTLLELRGYLLAGNCDDGTREPQTIKWCASGDPANWTTLDSGETNLFNSLGPIQKLIKINQIGFAAQYDGFTQIIPTGSGQKPFDFVPFASQGKGCRFAYTPSSFGDVGVCYVASDNVYLFTGSECVPIGSRPLDGNRRRGAQASIMNDIRNKGDLVYGQVITDCFGFPYRTYWIMHSGGAWVYSFDDDCWFEQNFNFGAQTGPRTIGRFPKLISGNNIDVIGIGDNSALSTVNAQLWPISLQNFTPGSAVVETADISSSIITNFDSLGRPDINKNVFGLRLVFRDCGSFNMGIGVVNEKGLFPTINSVSYTTQTVGNLYEIIVRFKTSGLAFQTTIIFTGNSAPWIQKLSLLYSLGGPYK